MLQQPRQAVTRLAGPARIIIQTTPIMSASKGKRKIEVLFTRSNLIKKEKPMDQRENAYSSSGQRLHSQSVKHNALCISKQIT
jgi:hypothetical protein